MPDHIDRTGLLAELTGSGGPFEVELRTVRGVELPVYAHAPASLRDVLESSRRHGDATYLVYDRERWSFADNVDIATGLAHVLLDTYDLRPGDRIAIAMRNYPEWVQVFWAAQAAGLVVVPLNAWWKADELAFAVRDAGVSLIVADDERLEVLGPVRADLGVDTIIGVRTDAPDVVRWEEVLSAAPANATAPDISIGPDDDATILYTSGTTGQPKGAVGTHRNHITNVTNMALLGALGAPLTAPPTLTPGTQAATIQTFPFFHVAGMSGIYIGASFGTKLVLMYKWDTDQVLEVVERERITSLSAVPTLVRQLLDHPDLAKHDLSSVSRVSTGGAPVPPELIERIDRQFGSQVAPGTGYGLTETTSAVINLSGEDYLRKPTSVGRPIVVASMRVVDPESQVDVASGDVGEVWVKGANVVRGYWNNPEATAASFTDGWFHTGDMGFVDPDGDLHLVDRLKDVIIRGGENVYSAEIESVLFEHPEIEDVAVVGVPDTSLGEVVAAVVVRRPGSVLDERAVQDHVAARLARFKVPSIVAFWSDPLPKTATGKIVKRTLREQLVAADD